MRTPFKSAAYLFLLLFFAGCATQSNMFNEPAYRHTVELKVTSLDLISKSSSLFEDHSNEVEDLRFQLRVAYEYAKGRPDHDVVAHRWERLLDADDNQIETFLLRWEERDRLPPAFIREYREIVSSAFDVIIGLESGKLDPDAYRPAEEETEGTGEEEDPEETGPRFRL